MHYQEGKDRIQLFVTSLEEMVLKIAGPELWIYLLMQCLWKNLDLGILN